MITPNTWHPVAGRTWVDVWMAGRRALNGRLCLAARDNLLMGCWYDHAAERWTDAVGCKVPHSAVTHFMVVVLPGVVL